MSARLPPSLALFVMGLMLSFGGIVLIVAPLLFAPSLPLQVVQLLPVPALLLLPGAAMLLAGIGLCRACSWAWYLALGIAVTGLGVLLWRLLANGAAEWPMLLGALVTDAIIAFVLLQARPTSVGIPGS